jgi:hypothetical protein
MPNREIRSNSFCNYERHNSPKYTPQNSRIQDRAEFSAKLEFFTTSTRGNRQNGERRSGWYLDAVARTSVVRPSVLHDYDGPLTTSVGCCEKQPRLIKVLNVDASGAARMTSGGVHSPALTKPFAQSSRVVDGAACATKPRRSFNFTRWRETSQPFPAERTRELRDKERCPSPSTSRDRGPIAAVWYQFRISAVLCDEPMSKRGVDCLALHCFQNDDTAPAKLSGT